MATKWIAKALGNSIRKLVPHTVSFKTKDEIFIHSIISFSPFPPPSPPSPLLSFLLVSAMSSVPSLSAPVTSTVSTHAAKFDNQTFVLHVDIFILAIFGLFSLMTLPRLFARYSHKAEWSLGHILRAVPLTGAGDRWKRNFPASVIPDELYNTTMETGSEDSHTLYSHTHIALDEKTHQAEKPSQPKSWSTRLHSATALLGYPMATGYSVGRVIVMLGYFSVILYASVYKSSPFSDFMRTGYVAMAQFPIVVALATKNNILGMFLAVGYEKVRRVISQYMILTNFDVAQLSPSFCRQTPRSRWLPSRDWIL